MAKEPFEPPEGSLGGKVSSGLRWSFANTAVAKTLSVLSGVALARILLPEDFGVYAVAIAVVNILFGLNDLGLLLAVVRWPGDLKDAVRTATTLATASSVALYGLCFAAAPAFADFVNSPESVGVLRLLAFTVVIDGVSTASQGLLVRDFRQDRMAVAEWVAMPLGIVVTVALALSGAGAWSLAIGQVVTNCVSGACLIAFAPFRVMPGFRPETARAMLSFGVPLAFTSLLEYALLNADYVIVSRALGPVAVGFYLLAFNISNWPLTVLTDAIRRVSIAGFARLSDDMSSTRERFGRAFTLLIVLAFPVILTMGILARPLVGFVYGSRWGPSAQVLSFLAVLTAVRITVGFVFDLLVGVGRSRTTLWLQGVWLVALVPALALGAHLGGIRGVAVAHGIVGVGLALPLFLRSAHRLGVDLGATARGLVRPAAGGAAAAVVAAVLLPRLDGNLVELLVVGPAMLAAYAALVVPLDGERRRRWLNGLLKGGTPPPGPGEVPSEPSSGLVRGAPGVLDVAGGEPEDGD